MIFICLIISFLPFSLGTMLYGSVFATPPALSTMLKFKKHLLSVKMSYTEESLGSYVIEFHVNF